MKTSFVASLWKHESFENPLQKSQVDAELDLRVVKVGQRFVAGRIERVRARDDEA